MCDGRSLAGTEEDGEEAPNFPQDLILVPMKRLWNIWTMPISMIKEYVMQLYLLWVEVTSPAPPLPCHMKPFAVSVACIHNLQTKQNNLMCMHTCMHTHTCTHTHMCTHTRMHAHRHTHTRTHSLLNTCTFYTHLIRERKKNKTCPVNSSKTDLSFYIPAMKSVHICICV